MAYLRQIYQATSQLPDGRMVEVRYAVDRIAHSFDAEPEEHYGTELWIIEERAVDPKDVETMIGSARMNKLVTKALPMGQPFLPASKPGLYDYH